MPDTPRGTPAIVLVEDDQDIVSVMKYLLRPLAAGYAIETFTSGAHALAQIGLRPVPLVVTDYKMPSMNGLQLAAAFKWQSPSTYVVLLSGYITPELRREAYEQGIDYVLPKPFRVSEFKQILQEVFP